MGWPHIQYPIWQQTTILLCYSVLCFPLCSSPLPFLQHCQAPSTHRVQLTFQNHLLPSTHSWISVLRISSLICSSPATTFIPISRSGTNTVSSRDPSLATPELPSSVKSHYLLLIFTDNLLIIYSPMMDFSLIPCVEMFQWGPLDHPTWSPLPCTWKHLSSTSGVM